MEIRDPESRRISVILEPPRPLTLIQKKNRANKYKGDSHDAADHVGRNGDILSAKVGVIQIDLRAFARLPFAGHAGRTRNTASSARPPIARVTSKASSD